MNKKTTDYNPNRRTAADLQAVSKTLLPFSRQLLGARGFITVDILTKWPEIAGEEIACFSWPECIDFKRGEKNNGTLFLNVVSGACALELQHREKFILDKVNTYFGYAAVARLKIIQTSNLNKTAAANLSVSEPKKTLVTPEEENYIRSLSAEVGSPTLKELLQRLGRDVYNDNKKRSE